MSQINEAVATQVSEVSEKEESVMTKNQIMEALANNNVKFNKKSTKEELEALLESAIQAATESQAAAEEPAEQEAAPEEQAAEPAAEEKKPEEKKAKVVYKSYTSKKNLLKDYPQMETEINQKTIFNHGFTYGVTTGVTTGHIAVTYYFSKGNYYKYADACIDDNMQVTRIKFYQSIKEVKAAIKAQLFPEAGVEVEAPVAEQEVAPATAEEEVATA